VVPPVQPLSPLLNLHHTTNSCLEKSSWRLQPTCNGACWPINTYIKSTDDLSASQPEKSAQPRDRRNPVPAIVTMLLSYHCKPQNGVTSRPHSKRSGPLTIYDMKEVSAYLLLKRWDPSRISHRISVVSQVFSSVPVPQESPQLLDSEFGFERGLWSLRLSLYNKRNHL
jgi:hypothetical protein